MNVDLVMARLEQEGPGWLAQAYVVTERACLTEPVVTTDLLWPHLPFPTGRSGGRLLGRAIRFALAQRWMENAKTPEGLVLCHDHLDAEPAVSLDGVIIQHGSPMVMYRSLIFDGPTTSNGHPYDGEQSAAKRSD